MNTADRPAARRILVISAGFDAAVNEMSTVWRHLADTRDVEVCVVAPGADRLKGRTNAAGTHRHGRIVVHWLDRPFPLVFDPSIAAIADGFRPDTVFAGPRDHLDCALAVARHCGAQAALHIEYFFDDRHWLRRREYAGLTALRPLVGARTRRRALAQLHRVFVSDPRERARFGGDARLAYLPWPHRAPGIAPLARTGRHTGELLYIGSLFRAKGVARLADYFGAAIAAMPDLKIRLIGPPIDGDGEAALAAIHAAAGDRFEWTASVPRDEALALVARSFCVLSPGSSHGWGQIGDAWHLRTPVIAAFEHYELEAGRNCLVAGDAAAFVDAVRRLRTDPALADRLADGGRDRIAGHAIERTADAIADGLALAPLPRGVIQSPAGAEVEPTPA